MQSSDDDDAVTEGGVDLPVGHEVHGEESCRAEYMPVGQGSQSLPSAVTPRPAAHVVDRMQYVRSSDDSAGEGQHGMQPFIFGKGA